MAIFHLSVKTISRGKGQSSVASAAYRSASKLKDEFNNKTFDYSRKSGVAFTKIFLPENAPKEFYDRATLWNDIEKNENQTNSRLAREIEFALPVELSFDQQKKLACDFAKTFVDVGMCVDLAFHDKKNNPHCHMMLTTRSLDNNGHWLPKNKVSYKLDRNGNKIPVLDKNGVQKKEKNGKKIFEKVATPTNDWDKREKIEEWRKTFQDLANYALKKSNFKNLIDHRSYKRQGVDKIPTIHLGSSDAQKERNGQRTERGNINRLIYQRNLFNEKVKPTLEQYTDARKKIPSTDDPRNFRLWLLYAYRNVEKEQKQLQKDIDSGKEQERIANETNIINQLIADEKKNCDLNIKRIQQKIYDETQETQQQLLKLQQQIELEQKNLSDDNEQALKRTAEFKNREIAKAKLAETRKQCDELKKNWDDLYNEISHLKTTDPNYDTKIQEYNDARASYQETFAKTVPQKQEQVKIAEELLEKKRHSLQTSNPKIDALKNEIAKVQTSANEKNADFEFQIKQVENISNAKIAELNGQIKNLGNSTNLKLAELQKDKEFLQAIHKDFKTQFNKRPDPLWQKYKKDGESYPTFLINHHKELKLNIKNCDTSASFVRQLRQAEQEVQSPNFLVDLAKTLADTLGDTSATMPPAVACLSSGDAFEMPYNWDLISDLKKEEILHKRFIAEYI